MTTPAAKVLIVDDSALQRRVVSDTLREAGYQEENLTWQMRTRIRGRIRIQRLS